MNDEAMSNTEAEKELNETMLLILRKDILKKFLDTISGSFLTGSNYWYPNEQFSRKSDYDVCIPELYRDSAVYIIESYNLKNKVRPAQYNNGLYVSIGNEKINIIFLSQEDLKPWKMATDVMEFFIKEFDCIKTYKKIRIGVFQSIIALTKMLLAVK